MWSMLILVLTSMLWGCTNPFIKKYSSGIEQTVDNSFYRRMLNECLFLLSNWKFLVAFLLNQCGSVMFFIALSISDLSLASPLTNSLTFVITTLAGKMLGESATSAKSYIGMCLVVTGVTLCIISKL